MAKQPSRNRRAAVSVREDTSQFIVRRVDVDAATLRKLKELLGPDAVVDAGKLTDVAAGGCCRADW